MSFLRLVWTTMLTTILATSWAEPPQQRIFCSGRMVLDIIVHDDCKDSRPLYETLSRIFMLGHIVYANQESPLVNPWTELFLCTHVYSTIFGDGDINSVIW